MLRVHFSGPDLARVRIAARPDVLWETVLSFHRLRDRRSDATLSNWRNETRARLNGETRVLAPLVPTRGYFPDFLTPGEGLLGLGEALEAVRATPAERVHAEVSRLPAVRPLPSWVQALRDGEAAPLGRLSTALRNYYEAAVAPYWPHLRARIEADRAARGRALLDGGADSLLASLPPTMRWRPPVLEVDYPADRDLHLGGRGLLLLPSFFCRGMPVTFQDPDLTPVLVYPVERTPARPATAPAPSHSLGRLVGRTRSAILQGIGGGCTTSELARRVDVSLASASQHATVLRDAGLLFTLRHGSAVLHTLTPLGAALLRGQAPEVGAETGTHLGPPPPREPAPGQEKGAGEPVCCP
ncbi:winged helix-turn-helix domain-containing protein [Streptomyces sp. NPDC003077]|uniref:ArsR/SmtB family transcription factor n=1 Tax=Streptomyces sp. NPDC003077 TaxID=3154443 RepID=UPI0033A90F07